MLRTLSGNSTISFASRLAATLELSVFKSDAFAVTITDWVSVPTVMVTFCEAV